MEGCGNVPAEEEWAGLKTVQEEGEQMEQHADVRIHRRSEKRNPKFRYTRIALLAVVLSGSPVYAAETYPSKPIRMIVPFPSGGGTDFVARTLAQKLEKNLGQSVVVDNRPGGGGNIGTDMVAKATPNGYTILLGYVGSLAINPSLFRNLPYEPLKDFAPISLAAAAPNLLVVHPSLPANTVKDLVALAKGKPGTLTYATAGNGTVGHMVGELFKSVTGTDIVHVPYKGASPALTDLLGQRVQLFLTSPGSVMPLIQAKRLKALAVANAERLPDFADIPTFAEAGYPKVEASAWYGVLAPAGTPKQIIAILNKAISTGMQQPDVKQSFVARGFIAVTNSPDGFAQLLKADLVKWREVVKASGAAID